MSKNTTIKEKRGQRRKEESREKKERRKHQKTYCWGWGADWTLLPQQSRTRLAQSAVAW